ncbi:hypothetical protein [Clostridium novyi]|uniref:Conserved protein n=1 Tax=Clostridium novyi (strain NT) TaxID=386415 RepID=A0Q2J9_CLONN|nr:hypothetical protein [Clostridium novyi]ABK62414.1 conserved protein [Clostridium novyi NT]KEH85982.1 hypothetical protein Z967_07395 [Clostridium novyi A str. 4540]KEH86398.1 hypothetical protein Z966_02955 [Clostridium novyi A str. NCTC 538]KEH90358.1 hypothetical protein Z965_01190 [Clostridium novyi A str. BKT29909]KEH91981.1 hypothetical protein Z964_07695 [Clostridium novyi A str. GD211209]
MKSVKRIIAWICVSLGVQIAVLYYVDTYLFSTENVSSKIVSTKVEDNKKNRKSDINIEVPENAERKALSCDGQYLAYIENDRLKIVDTYSGDEENIELQQGLHMSFYKWAPDRNILLIAASKKSEEKSKFIFYSYDAEKGEKEKLQNKNGEETCFTAPRGTEVKDIELSPFTNMIYIKSGLAGGKSELHKINIMQKLNKVETKIDMIGDIKIIPNDDSIAYESVNQNKVYITGCQNPIKVDGVDKVCLVDVDDNDIIYVGEIETSSEQETFKIKNIYRGVMEKPLLAMKRKDTDRDKEKSGETKHKGKNKNTSTSKKRESVKESKPKMRENISYKWDRIALDKSVDKKDIFISREGKIYINDNLKGIVIELGSNTEIKYKGTFLQMYDGGIASISDGKLVETLLK